jgi:hypothetical protein
MKKFQDFVRYYESIGEKFKLIEDIVKICFERYPVEIKDFFQTIANKDPDVKNLMSQFNSNSSDDDSVTKPIADEGGGDEEM